MKLFCGLNAKKKIIALYLILEIIALYLILEIWLQNFGVSSFHFCSVYNVSSRKIIVWIKYLKYFYFYQMLSTALLQHCRRWVIKWFLLYRSEILEFPSLIKFDIITSDDFNFHFHFCRNLGTSFFSLSTYPKYWLRLSNKKLKIIMLIRYMINRIINWLFFIWKISYSDAL